MADNKNFRERYKHIAQSDEFRKSYEGMNIGEVIPIEEPSITEIVDKHWWELLGEESIPLNVQEAAHQYIFNTPSLILPLLHDTDLRWEKVVIEELERAFTSGVKWKESQISKDASKLT